MKKHLWAVIYSALLTAFTVYIAFDTFLIKRVYTVLPETESSDQSESSKNSEPEITDEQEAVSISVTDNSYSDGNISITLNEYYEYDTKIYVAEVKLSSAEYLKTAFAQNYYGRNITEKTSVTAEQNSAVLAINGDYYGAREKGYVIKNGIVYRNTTSSDQQDLVIFDDGSFEVINEDEITAEELVANGATELLSFGPALAENSKTVISEDDEVGKSMVSNPRTAIAQLGELHYLFIVSDGRTEESAGLSLYELAEFAVSLGAEIVYNLDGGGSSTMYFNGRVVNNPTTSGNSIKERSVSDIVYVGA